MRVTEIVLLNKCPSNFLRVKLDKSAIGTVIHDFCEQVLLGQNVSDLTVIERLRKMNVPDGEIENCLRYLETLRTLPMATLGVETNFTLDIEGVEPITGKVDAILVDGNGDYFVIDHKTGRERGVDWFNDAQMRLYALGVRRMYNLSGVVHILVGQINLGNFIPLKFTPQDDEITIQRVQELYRMYTERVSEERYGKHCSYCRFNTDCKTYLERTFADMTNLEKLQLPEQLKLLQEVVHNCQKRIDDIKGLVVASDGASSIGFRVKEGRRRTVNVKKLLRVLGLSEGYNNLFNVNVGALDIWLRENPQMKEEVLPTIENKTVNTVTIL